MNDGDTNQPHHGTGHRARLRQRLLQSGGDALLDHELIEYLLGLAIPRRDTKPLAKRLLAEFGGIGPLLAANPEALARVDGLGETSIAAIKLAQALGVRVLRSEVKKQSFTIAGWPELESYLRADMGHRLTECIRILHLNTKNQLIRDEVMSEGSIDAAHIHTREVIRRAIELGSAAIILVHNHPSGDPNPSRADIAMTREIADAGKMMGVAVHDHVIVAAEECRSMRGMGLI
jgi:DNA repair protein RadC